MASAPALGGSDMRPSGRSGWVSVQVQAVTPIARDTVTLALALPGTHRAPAPYQPGQYITLAFPGTRTTYYRSYSLCGDGESGRPWEITVKRQNAGIVSSFIYSNVRPGMQLQASQPQGRFTLPETIRPDIPIVFIAAGSGITPIYSMLRRLARLAPGARPQAYLHYAYHHPEDAIFGPELAALDPEHVWLAQWHYVATSGHRLGVDQVLASVRDGAARSAEWYICGPANLKRSLESALPSRGVSRSRVHTEVFASPGSAGASPSSTGVRSRIQLADSGAVLESIPGEVLLQTLERYGYRPDFNCRVGTCGTCRMRLLSGQVRQGDADGLTSAERAAGYVLSCSAHPEGDIVLASAGRAVTNYGNNAPNRVALARKRAKQRLRLGLVAASCGLFITAWGFTNHRPVSQSSTPSSNSNTVSPSNPGFFPSGNGSGSSSNQSGSGQSGSGSFSTQPGQNIPNTSTGVS
jgi:3-ketosteroid 9alpha-monooxygenase subunit B